MGCGRQMCSIPVPQCVSDGGATAPGDCAGAGVLPQDAADTAREPRPRGTAGQGQHEERRTGRAEAVAADPCLRGREVFAFATSAIRDTPNRDEINARVACTAGTRLRALSRIVHIHRGTPTVGGLRRPVLTGASLRGNGRAWPVLAWVIRYNGSFPSPECALHLPAGARFGLPRWAAPPFQDKDRTGPCHR